MKILIGVGSALLLFAFFYIGLVPPRAIATNISEGEEIAIFDLPIAITFDKPLTRQEVKAKIDPEVYGEWRFQDPIIENHLYRTIVFVPVVAFSPDTEYRIELKGLKNRLGGLASGQASFAFQTKEIPQQTLKEESAEESGPSIFILDIPVDWQDSPLSCEAASLKMALKSKGVAVSEGEIMEKVGHDATPREGDVWGNPFETFVGDIEGKICTTGFGVFWDPIAKAAENWGSSEAFSDWEVQDITRELQAGNPVIMWGVMPTGTITDCSWYTKEGKRVTAFRETHVRLIIGFMGEAENPTHIILNDPLSGRLYWTTEQFLTNWEMYGKSGVVIR